MSKVAKRFEVLVTYTTRNSCGGIQSVEEGDVRRAVEAMGLDNLRVSVKTMEARQ